MHYYSFNISDWTLATAHLSLEEEAVYFRLVNHYYDTEQPIPLETQSVIRRLRLGSHEKALELILAEFFIKTEKGFVNARCERELKEYRKLVKKNRENGSKGGRPKKIKGLPPIEEKPTGNPLATDSEPTGNPPNNQEPITNNQEPITKKNTNPWPGLKSLDGIDFGKWPSLPAKETMQQWLAVRKSKKATNSQIAMDDVCSHLIAASIENLTADDCIRFAVAKSWAGFNYQWLKNERGGSARSAASAPPRHNEFENRDYTAGVTADGTF